MRCTWWRAPPGTRRTTGSSAIRRRRRAGSGLPPRDRPDEASGPGELVAADGAAAGAADGVDDPYRLRPDHLQGALVPAHHGDAVGGGDALGVARDDGAGGGPGAEELAGPRVVVEPVDGRRLGQERVRRL